MLALSTQIEIGDILTSLIIIISIASLIYTLKKDRLLRQREQADIIRNSAAQTIAKLDRWRELSLSIFASMDALFVKASNELIENDFDLQYIRDFLWIELNSLRINLFAKILNENIETVYVDLYSYDPLVRTYFENVLARLKDEENIVFNVLLDGIQERIENTNITKENHHTSTFRTPLKLFCDKIYEIYLDRINRIIAPVGNELLSLISKSDEELLSKQEKFFINSCDIFPPLDSDIYLDEPNSEFLYGKI